MRHDDCYLIDMLLGARKAADFATGLDYSQFCKQDLHQFAVLKALEIIGEAASRISEETRRAYPDIPWRQIVGLRNRVVHGYFDVNLELVWQIVQEDVPTLIHQLEKLLPSDAPEGGS